MPPRIAAYDNGMRNLRSGSRALRAHCFIIGMNTTTTGVLFRNADTDVIFTDIESRKQYTIGYITHGMSETIQLEKGKWYSVEGAGELTIRPDNVRIE